MKAKRGGDVTFSAWLLPLVLHLRHPRISNLLFPDRRKCNSDVNSSVLLWGLSWVNEHVCVSSLSLPWDIWPQLEPFTDGVSGICKKHICKQRPEYLRWQMEPHITLHRCLNEVLLKILVSRPVCVCACSFFLTGFCMIQFPAIAAKPFGLLETTNCLQLWGLSSLWWICFRGGTTVSLPVTAPSRTPQLPWAGVSSSSQKMALSVIWEALDSSSFGPFLTDAELHIVLLSLFISLIHVTSMNRYWTWVLGGLELKVESFQFWQFAKNFLLQHLVLI